VSILCKKIFLILILFAMAVSIYSSVFTTRKGEKITGNILKIDGGVIYIEYKNGIKTFPASQIININNGYENYSEADLVTDYGLEIYDNLIITGGDSKFIYFTSFSGNSIKIPNDNIKYYSFNYFGEKNKMIRLKDSFIYYKDLIIDSEGNFTVNDGQNIMKFNYVNIDGFSSEKNSYVIHYNNNLLYFTYASVEDNNIVFSGEINYSVNIYDISSFYRINQEISEYTKYNDRLYFRKGFYSHELAEKINEEKIRNIYDYEYKITTEKFIIYSDSLLCRENGFITDDEILIPFEDIKEYETKNPYNIYIPEYDLFSAPYYFGDKTYFLFSNKNSVLYLNRYGIADFSQKLSGGDYGLRSCFFIGDNLYIETYDSAYFFNPESNLVKSQISFKTSKPVMYKPDGTILIVSADLKEIKEISLSDGEILKKYDLNIYLNSIVQNDKFFFAGTSEGIIKYSKSDIKVLKNAYENKKIILKAFSDSRIYAETDEEIICLDDNLNILWRLKIKLPENVNFITDENYNLYFISGNYLYKIYDGNIIYRVKTTENSCAVIFITENNRIYIADKSDIKIVDAETGSISEKIDIKTNNINLNISVSDRGYIYIFDTDGFLRVYRAEESLKKSWSAYGSDNNRSFYEK